AVGDGLPGGVHGVADDEGEIRLVHDVDGRVVRAVDERGRTLVIERDGAGRPGSVTDRRGVTRRIEADSAGRPRTVVAGPGRERFSWDVRGLLASAADALGNA